jgi:hypothetical protein
LESRAESPKNRTPPCSTAAMCQAAASPAGVNDRSKPIRSGGASKGRGRGCEWTCVIAQRRALRSADQPKVNRDRMTRLDLLQLKAQRCTQRRVDGSRRVSGSRRR